MHSLKNSISSSMYKYLIVIQHPGLESKEVSLIYSKLQTLAPPKQREFFDAWYHPKDSTVFLCEVETIKEADNVAVILNDIRRDILTNPKHTIECNIISNVMRL